MEQNRPTDPTQGELSSAATTTQSSPTIRSKTKPNRLDSPTTTSQTISQSSPTTSAGISTSELLEPDEGDDDDDDDQAEARSQEDERATARELLKVHGHTLPSGWTCHYDPDTDEYNFELHEPAARSSAHVLANRATPTQDDTVQTSRRPTLNVYECKYGYHFPTTPTSSMISELAKQVQKTSSAPPTAPKTKQVGYGKHKLTILSSEDEQSKRLNEMFPTATAPVVEQMISIYHGREGLIKAALISLGYKRAIEYRTQQSTNHSPIMLMMSKPASKKLFDKLISYFPDKDADLIKGLMYRHKEVEHEIISALVESSQEEQIAQYHQTQLDKFKTDKNGAIMKLRYLKFLYPTCEEIELYHLLHCHDLNAQKVMEVVEERGHKRVNIEEVLQNRKTQTQQIRAQQQAHAVKDKPPSGACELLEAHEKRPKPTISETRLKNLKDNLKKAFGDLDDGLLSGALEATDYNESLAKRFLEEMEPVDDAHYKQRYELPRETGPKVVAFPCKAIQKGDTTFMSIVAYEYVYIAKEVIECENALALLKVDASTYTEEDFPKQKSTSRLGKKLGLAIGSANRVEKKLRESLCRRSQACAIRIGSKYNEICQDQTRVEPTKRAIGCDKTLVYGRNASLKFGHNPKLLERMHPFFKPKLSN